MIIDIPYIDYIYMMTEHTDFRKGILSLAALVRDIYNLDPFSNSVFIFSNKKEGPSRFFTGV